MKFASQQDRLSGLEQKIEYQFRDRSRLLTAITHSSYANEQKEPPEYNERMEFLGDAVLELVVSDYLYRNHPEKKEGALTKMRAGLVCEPALAACARSLNLGEYLYLGKGESAAGGNDRDSILSDAFESVIGAIYLDSGMEAAGTFIRRHLLCEIEDRMLFYDAKTILQEKVQGECGEKPEYILTGTSGPQHQRTFHVKVCVRGKELASGEGHSKKSAEQMAAYLALKKEKDNRRCG